MASRFAPAAAVNANRYLIVPCEAEGCADLAITMFFHSVVARTAGFSTIDFALLSDAALLRLLVTHPLLTLKVTAAIHWHALRLLAKRISWRPHPAAPELPFSLGRAVTAHAKGPMKP